MNCSDFVTDVVEDTSCAIRKTSSKTVTVLVDERAEQSDVTHVLHYGRIHGLIPTNATPPNHASDTGECRYELLFSPAHVVDIELPNGDALPKLYHENDDE